MLVVIMCVFPRKCNWSPIIWSISGYVSLSVILKLQRLCTVSEMWASQKENYRDFGLYLCPSWPFFKPQTSYSAAAGSSYLPPHFFQLFVLEVLEVAFFLHIFRWTQNMRRLRTMNMSVYTRRKNIYVCLHTHIKVVSGGNLKSMSWYLKSAGNTNVKCEHIWVTKTNTHFITS